MTHPPKQDHAQRGNFDFAINDINRMTYYTTMYVGSNQQEMRIGFDSMTPVSLINSANCEGCQTGVGFEYPRSYTIRKITDEKITF